MPEETTAVNYSLKSGERSILVHQTPVLHVRLPIDPYLAASKDDRFRLYSSDGKYDTTLTIKDDKVNGDAFVDLVFGNLKVGQKYSLEVDPGAEGEPYHLFEEVPYRELIDYYSLLDPGDELEEEEESEDEENEAGEDDSDWEEEGESSEEYGGDPDDDDDEMAAIIDGEEADESDLIDWNVFDPSRGLDEAEDEDEDKVEELADWDS